MAKTVFSPLLPQFFYGLTTRLGILITWVIVSAILINLPGQNYWQLLEIHPQPTLVKAIAVDLGEPSLYPIAQPNSISPPLSAAAAIVIDNESGVILLAKNPDTQLLPASTTKIMTAAVVLDQYQLGDIVEIKNEDRSIGHTAELIKGEKLTVKDLLFAMLINSGNDAALALAQYHPRGYDQFVELMNQKARQWHMNNSHFMNVSGIEQFGHYTSVRDLALLTKQMMKQPLFAEIVATKKTTITSITGQKHVLVNLNELLDQIEGIKGVKTGWTENAGECLVTITQRNGHEIITVILGSRDRFGESKRLIEWAFANHQWKFPEIN